jgi:hypothetical protein
MPRVGFEPRTPVFEWGKTVRALDRAATEIALFVCARILLFNYISKVKVTLPLCLIN